MFSMVREITPPPYCIPPAEDQISHLPAEILTLCLILACLVDQPYDKSPVAWTLSLVCQRWRKLLADYPKLWTKISLNWKPRVIQAYLEHSNPLPVELDLHLQDTSLIARSLASPGSFPTLATTPSYLSSAFSAMGRVRKLRMNIISIRGQYDGIWPMLDEHQAPILEKLHISGDVILRPTIFGGRTPGKLQTLILSSCRVLHGNPLLSAPVTDLTISSYPDSPLVESNQHDIIEAVRCFPSLKKLCIYATSMERYRAIPLEFIPVVNLSCLEELEVHDVPGAIIAFLSVFRIPTSANLHISLHIPDEMRYADPDDRWSGQVAACEEVAALITRHLSRAAIERTSFKSLQVSFETQPKGMLFELLRDVEDNRTDPPSSEAPLLPKKLQFRCHFPYEPWNETFGEEPTFVERILPVFPACHALQRLTVKHALESPDVWIDGYSRFAVEQITVRYEYVTALSLISAIKSAPTLFPRLSVLVLEEMILTETIDPEDLRELLPETQAQLPPEYQGQDLNGLLHRELVKFLKIDIAPRLSLRCCRLTQTSLEELRNSAGAKGLDWDDQMAMSEYW